MKSLVILLGGAALFGALHHSPCLVSLFHGEGDCAATEECGVADAFVGDYVELRSASVYAGPCHYNGEYDSQGREALSAWRFDAGAWGDVHLAGAKLVAAVEAGENLADGGERVSVLWVDAPSALQRDAAVAWARARCSDALGHVAAVETAEIAFEREGDGYAISIEGVLEARGTAMADRRCCTMKENRWYEPIAGVAADPIVGFSDVCTFEGAHGLARWSYQEQNNAFVTAFHDPLAEAE